MQAFMKRIGISKLGMMMLVGVIGVATTSVLSGCNTIEGAGEDIESGGEAVERAAE